MFDLGRVGHDLTVLPKETTVTASRSLPKIAFDLALTCLLMIPLVIVSLALVLLNPFYNPGPLIFRQNRMGQDCRAFTALKFRTMTLATAGTRGAFDCVEDERISGLGRFLRKSHLDELPQIINVLRGEMSLIGPRPDNFEHACIYLRQIPDYAKRHQILPGISGYAQTEVGYVEGFAAVLRKVEADLYYLRHASFRFDLWITWRTVCVVLGRHGS